MRHLVTGIALAATLVVLGESADAQSWGPLADSQRCPSKWGAGDQRGSANHMKPESVLRATRLIRAGEVIELGHVLSADMPISSTRRFDMHTKRTFMNPQSNRRGSNEEVVLSEIGQVGTRFDGFATPDHREQPLQLVQARRDLHAHRLDQAQHRERRRARHARRAHRRHGA